MAVTETASRRVPSSRRWIVAGTALALFVAACGTSAGTPDAEGNASVDPTSTTAETVTGSTAGGVGPNAADANLSLADATAALADPATAASGILSILRHLGIGVYTIEGRQVLAGSETHVDDLWVPAQAIAGLARSAVQRSGSFANYHRGITAWAGVDISEGDLAFMYQDMVATLPDHPMSQVLVALDAVPDVAKPLSPFEQWLLLIILTAPNGDVPPRPGGTAAGGLVVATATPSLRGFFSSHCDFAGDNSDPDYDLTKQYLENAVGEAHGALVDELASEISEGAATYGSGVKSAADLVKGLGKALGWVGKLIDFSKLSAILGNVELEVALDKPSTHRVHDHQGDTVEKQRIEVTASVTWLGQPDPPDDVSCDDGWDLGLPPPGRMENAGVRVTLDDFLVEQGWIRRKGDENTARQLTGENGEVVVWYEPRDEEPASAQELGNAFVQKGTGQISAEFDLVSAFAEFFNAFASLEIIADLFDVMKISTPIRVERHDPAVQFEEVRPIDNGLLAGESIFKLSTCDGVNWTGAHTYYLAGDVQGGTMELIGDTPLTFVMASGATSVETEISGTANLTGNISGAAVKNTITTTGTATLELHPDTGTGTVTLTTEGGGQDISIVAPPGSASGGGEVNPDVTTFSLPITANESCSD